MQRHSHHTVHCPTQPPSHQHFCRYLDSATAFYRWASGICRGISYVLISNRHQFIDININTSIGPSRTWRLIDLPNGDSRGRTAGCSLVSIPRMHFFLPIPTYFSQCFRQCFFRRIFNISRGSWSHPSLLFKNRWTKKFKTYKDFTNL